MEIWEGIDVSQFNGGIDFDRVRAAGKSFVMVRAGWCGYDGSIQKDTRFDVNMREAVKAGLNVGIYLYSYAKTPQAACTAADSLLEMAGAYRMTYPVALDMEDSSLQGLGKARLTEIARAFLERIEEKRYYASLYTSYGWMQSFLLPEELARFDWWIADWRQGTMPGNQWGMWQYRGDQGRVDGVSGPCDLDRAYRDYPSIMEKYGLNGLKPPEPEDENTAVALRKEVERLRREAQEWEEKYKELEAGLRALLQTDETM